MSQSPTFFPPNSDAPDLLFRSLIQNSSDGIALVDAHGMVSYMSPSGAAILGLPEEGNAPISIFDVVLPEERERLAVEFQSLLNTPGGTRIVNIRIATPDGSVRWIESVNSNMLGNPAIGAIVSNFRDASERVRADLERDVLFEIMQVVHTHTNLNAIFEHIHRALKRVVYAENCFVTLYNATDGLFHKVFLVDQFDDNFPPQRLTKSLTAYVFRTGVAASIDLPRFEQLIAAGEVELVGTNSPSWVGIPLKTPTETIGVLALQHYEKADVYSARDVQFLEYVGGQIALIIERRRAEERLTNSLSLLTATLDSTTDGILVVDRNGRIAGYNRKYLEIWNIPAEIAESGDADALLGYARQQLRNPGQALANRKDLYEGDEPGFELLRFTDGRMIERYSQSQNIDGQSVGRVWSYRDVTEQHQARELQDAIYHIAEAAGAAQNVDALFPAVHRIIQSIMPADHFCIALHDAGPGRLRIAYCTSGMHEFGKPFADERSILTHIHRTGKSVLAGSGELANFVANHNITMAAPLPSVVLGVPLKTDRDTIGTIRLQHNEDASVYGERELKIIEFISGQVARAIERKLADQQINLLAQAIESASEAISITDPDGRVVFVNRHFQDAYGYELADILGHPADMLHASASDAERYEAIIDKAAIGAGRAELTQRRKDGSVFPVFMTVSAMKDDNGRITGYATVARNISEIKEAEAALRESEERYRTLIENVRDAIFRISPDGRIVSLNAAFASITGWNVGEWIGRSFTSIIHTDDFPVAVDMFRTVLGGDTPDATEMRVRTREGDYITAEITAIPLLHDGVVIGVLGDARDITERKRLEDHLRQSQKMESIGILAGGIAHDFNNILTIIIAYASALQQPNLPADKISQCVEAIKKTSYRGADLVQQILTFARKTGLSRESVRLNPVLEDLARLLSETLPKTITINLQLDPNSPSIIGDNNQLHQAILNLCVNARDAMPSGGTLTLSTMLTEGAAFRERFREAEEDRYLVLRVSDTGSGIAQANRTHIFEPFFTTKERGRGTGLGLAVVYGIVKTHSGHIAFETEPGKGTTFILGFPVAPPVVEKDSAAEASKGEITGGSETILFVEDEEMLLDLLRNILVSKGYTVLTARDGVEAVNMYHEHRKEIAIVLSDIGLPRMSGTEAFQRMKALNPEIKVILASGYLDPRLKTQMAEQGAKAFVQKPYEPDEIMTKIREILDGE